jgi:hypothetical protein
MLPLEPFFFPQDAWVGKERAHLCLLQAQKVQRQPQPSQAHPFPRRKETAPPVCSQIPTFQVEVHVGPLVPFPSPSIPALQSSLMHRNTLVKDLAMLRVCAAAAFAQPPQEGPRPPAPSAQAPAAQGSQEKGKEDKKPPEEKVSQTKHTIQIGGKEVKYMATAGTMLLKKEDGTATASIFYIASVISWMTGFHL